MLGNFEMGRLTTLCQKEKIVNPEEKAKQLANAGMHPDNVDRYVARGLPFTQILALIQKYGPLAWQLISEIMNNITPLLAPPTHTSSSPITPK